MNYLLYIILGLITGSFISVLTYRIPNDMPFVKGRSMCPKCKKKIKWFDNIPLFSYLFLNGKCRSCKKRISVSYPLTEISTAFLFLFIGISKDINCNFSCLDFGNLEKIYIPLFFFISVIFISIFIIDLRYKIIPDSLVFTGLGVVFLISTIFYTPDIYERVFSSLLYSFFFLLLHLITKGKGMGLGDVKLTLLITFILGQFLSPAWLFSSFVLGALVGIILIIFKKAKFGRQIPFGPFMIISFYLVLFFENYLYQVIGNFL